MSKRIPRPGERPVFLLLYIGPQRHFLRIPIKAEGLIFGRNTSDTHVDIDMTPYNAIEHGVSREHVVIVPKRDHVIVKDLDTINSTWLNKKRLRPNMSTDLYHGDILHLAELKVEIFFAYEDDLVDNLSSFGNTKRLDAGEISAPPTRQFTENEPKSAPGPAFDTQVPDDFVNPFDEEVPNQDNDWDDNPGVTKRFDD
jgi:hypothetical protein